MELSIDEENKSYLSKGMLWLMAIGAGLVVANIYYNQPLLGMIARDLGASEAATSNIAMATQMGYAAGLLFIIPLGDMFSRKKIIFVDFIFMLAALLIFAFSKSLIILVVTGFCIGLTSVLPQVFIPIVVQTSAPAQKNRNVGIVMGGLLIGILGARVFSGLLGEYFGWREVFIVAAGFMFILAVLLIWLLPGMKPNFKGTYGQLMSSILYYARIIPSLRLASLRGALGFGAFSIFWTTLSYHLEQPPFFRGSDVAGMLGLVGIAGALAASLAGYISGKVSKNIVISVACLLMILSWVIFGFTGYTYLGLIVGIILLDMGLQGMHVTNQTIVFSTHPEATSRLNTVYMVSYFIGGSIGTFVGAKAWDYYGWNGVSIAGAVFVILCMIVHLLSINIVKKAGTNNFIKE